MRGVFLEKSTLGYTVSVDGVRLPIDVSWSEADQLARSLAEVRPVRDGRGYARCEHGRACFDAMKCLQSVHHE